MRLDPTPLQIPTLHICLLKPVRHVAPGFVVLLLRSWRHGLPHLDRRARRQLRSGMIARGLVLGGLLLAGCATPGPVTIRNPRTNGIAGCTASYRQVLDGSFRSQEDCIADY